MISNQSTAGFWGKMWVVMQDPQSNTGTKVSKVLKRLAGGVCSCLHERNRWRLALSQASNKRRN